MGFSLKHFSFSVTFQLQFWCKKSGLCSREYTSLKLERKLCEKRFLDKMEYQFSDAGIKMTDFVLKSSFKIDWHLHGRNEPKVQGNGPWMSRYFNESSNYRIFGITKILMQVTQWQWFDRMVCQNFNCFDWDVDRINQIRSYEDSSFWLTGFPSLLAIFWPTGLSKL